MLWKTDCGTLRLLGVLDRTDGGILQLTGRSWGYLRVGVTVPGRERHDLHPCGLFTCIAVTQGSAIRASCRALLSLFHLQTLRVTVVFVLGGSVRRGGKDRQAA